jgi:hypothetical protein
LRSWPSTPGCKHPAGRPLCGQGSWRCAAIAGLLAWALTSPLQAHPPEEPPQEAAERDDELPAGFEPGWLPTAAAVFPGVVFHGTGLWLAGDADTAYDLARVQAIGLVTTTVGLLGIYGTGASQKTIAALYPTTLVGSAGFIVPWLADLYGASTGGRAAGAKLSLAPVEARAGFAYAYDPIFDYANFGFARADLRVEPVTLSPQAWVALDDDNQRLRLQADARLLGPRAGERQPPADGSFVDLETAVTYHRFGTERFETLTVEAAVATRYDMRRLGASLRGSFAELAVGLGAQTADHYTSPTGLGNKLDGLLLVRSAFGVYLGSQGRYGEAKLYYDHRHDDFAAGSGLGTRVDGIAGHVGLEGFYYPFARWGAFADLQAGSAYLALLGVTFRYGDQR